MPYPTLEKSAPVLDFKNFPLHEFNLSGTLLFFRDIPRHSTFPNPIRPKALDIYKDHLYRRWENGQGRSLELGQNHWWFVKNATPGGGGPTSIAMKMLLQRRASHKKSAGSLFNRNNTIGWMVDSVKAFDFRAMLLCDLKNDCAEFERLQNLDYQSRKMTQGIQKFNSSVFQWVEQKINWSGKIEANIYGHPLTDDHLLMVLFAFPYDIKQTAQLVVASFMKNVDIVLSPAVYGQYRNTRRPTAANV